jgi:hypothetical protein
VSEPLVSFVKLFLNSMEFVTSLGSVAGSTHRTFDLHQRRADVASRCGDPPGCLGHFAGPGKSSRDALRKAIPGHDTQVAIQFTLISLDFYRPLLRRGLLQARRMVTGCVASDEACCSSAESGLLLRCSDSGTFSGTG